jgi:hypothetical protein
MTDPAFPARRKRRAMVRGALLLSDVVTLLVAT